MPMNTVGAVIVTYNPKLGIEERIYAALLQVGFLVLVDNSENSSFLENNKKLLSKKNIHIIKNSENVGIAKALNQGCSYLKDNGYSYALLLDQDSKISESLVDVLYGYSRSVQNCGIIGPLIIPDNINYDSIKSKLRFVNKTSAFSFSRIYPLDTPFEVAFNITSGSLCDLNIWDELGGFWEDLFIDGVDNEYGLRLLNSGYTTIIHPGATLYQEFGEQKEVSFLGRKFFPSFHGARRRYYSSRNRVLIWKRYIFTQPFYLMWDLLSFINTIKMIVLFEDQKFKNLYFILLGFRDGIFNKVGGFRNDSH